MSRTHALTEALRILKAQAPYIQDDTEREDANKVILLIEQSLQVENLVVFRVVYVPHTNTTPSRVRIYSERFKQFVTVSYHDEKFNACRDAQEIAITELRERGFSIVGIGEGKDCMYVFSDTFKPFKQS